MTRTLTLTATFDFDPTVNLGLDLVEGSSTAVQVKGGVIVIRRRQPQRWSQGSS